MVVRFKDPYSVSTEGFFDFFKKWFSDKDEPKTEAEVSVYKWVTENTQNDKLKPHLSLVGDSVTISLPGNLLLGRKLPTALSVTDLVRELSKDLPNYSQTKLKHVSSFNTANAIKNALSKELDKALHDFELFRKITLSYKNKLPAPYKLGDEEQITPLRDAQRITVGIVSIDDLNALLKVANGIWMQSWRLEDALGDTLGLDASDPPFRGFIDEIDDDQELMNILNPYWHPEFEERYPNPIEAMTERMSDIYSTAIELIRKSVK